MISLARTIERTGVPMWLVGPVLIVPLFSLSGGAAPFFLLPYGALWLASMSALPLMGGSLEATEYVISLGWRRTDLARVYLQRVVVSSALHGLAFALAWTLRGFDGAATLGLEPPGLFFKVLVWLFAIQVLARSVCMLLANAPVATCFSPAWRGCWTGDGRSFWRTLATAGACCIIAGVPIAIATYSVVQREPMWIALPAIPYFLALAFLVRTVEISSVKYAWDRPTSSRGRRFRIRPGAGPVRALGWLGMSSWVWASGALLVTPACIVLVLKIGDLALAMHTLWFGLAGWFILSLVAGGKMFRWSSQGDSGELLYMAGLQPAYLRRFKLLVAGAIVLGAGALAAVALLDVVKFSFREEVAWFLTRQLGGFIAIGGAAHLLLWMNESPVMTWKGRTLRGTDVAMAARIAICGVIVLVMVAEQLTGVDLERGETALWPTFTGLAMLLPATVFWFIGWFRAAERE